MLRLSYRLVVGFSGFVTLIVGLVGNALVIAVIITTRSLHTPTNCYLVSVAVSDFLLILTANMEAVITQVLFGDMYFHVHSLILCRIWATMQYLCADVSALSIAAFSVERWIAVCHPLKAQRMCTIDRALKIITAIWVLNIAYCSSWLFLSEQEFFNTEFGFMMLCKPANIPFFFWNYMADFILFYVFPLTVTAVLYVQIAKKLYTHKSSRTHSMALLLISRICCCCSNNPIQITAHDEDNGGSIINGSHQNSKLRPFREGQVPTDIDYKQSAKRLKARRSIVKMLMIVVILFTVLCAPYRVMMVINDPSAPRIKDAWFKFFATYVLYINSAINPILYNAMSRKFRRAFKDSLLRVTKYG
ncbi:hypothetical protein Ciccas_008431 [Cichlidogyrus casuarinus]|uniref:Thyrotropin-releasing hormone receptor n=1 Tax=Cichlidogyrus casuarinus TaxID=1844966 RepID=A0ABD2Q2L0_9PLAT